MRPVLKAIEQFVEVVIFGSRWIQTPLYLGLIIASGLYCYRFILEVVGMCRTVNDLKEEELLLAVLGLVDVTMVLNLVYMVVIGGYTMFVSKIDMSDHPDRPEWLEHTNANTLKIKLASSLVGVSGIHLLKSFIELGAHAGPESHASVIPDNVVMWQVIIHATFLGSAIALAITERLLHPPHSHKQHALHPKDHEAAEPSNGEAKLLARH